ncbi:transcription elongation factor [unidentified eubacterium SCB49]|nr:transcription elongation factor [unidentified eubacterium SCB49]
MKYGSVIIEKKEYVFLKRILNISGYAADFEIQKSFKRLNEELKTAIIVDEEEMPTDVIRFNSQVLISTKNGWKKEFQIVSPALKDVKADKISILTVMGAALFGYAQGDTVEWEFPTGKNLITIEKVAQVESERKLEMVK